MPSAIISWGGWDGHEPDKVADLFREILESEGYQVAVHDTLSVFEDADHVRAQDLIVPIWTMSTITAEQRDPILAAVRDHGTGIAGCHGGMCDAFRVDCEWQFLTGGQFVGHPGNDGVRYPVHLRKDHPITEGLEDFKVVSEQYYMHTDPGNDVLATTPFPTPGIDGHHVQNSCQMPTVWTRHYGKGRVFYNALGHNRSVLEPATPRELMRRGFLWATRSA